MHVADDGAKRAKRADCRHTVQLEKARHDEHEDDAGDNDHRHPERVTHDDGQPFVAGFESIDLAFCLSLTELDELGSADDFTAGIRYGLRTVMRELRWGDAGYRNRHRHPQTVRDAETETSLGE